jgi:hypothetical protein
MWEVAEAWGIYRLDSGNDLLMEKRAASAVVWKPKLLNIDSRSELSIVLEMLALSCY